MGGLLAVLAILASALLACFGLRRALFVAAALLPARSRTAGGHTPSVALLVPARNEAETAPALLEALSEIDYPAERLVVVLVSDGSTDGTAEIFAHWAANRARTLALSLPSVGKFEALNRAIHAAPTTDVVAICDADLVPRGQWLLRLVAPFASERVGATTGLVWPGNASSSVASRYAAVEAWVHQLVTSAAKDRLGLNPPTLALSAFRRRALEDIGLFSGNGAGGDALATAALTRAGWHTRFVPDAVAATVVAQSWGDYWSQHVRWARNAFLASAGWRARPPAKRATRWVDQARLLEGWLAASGYADRLVFVSVGGLVVVGALPLWLPVGYVGIAIVEIAVALAKARVGRAFPAYLLATSAGFLLDVLASFAATAAHLLRVPPDWRQSRRAALTDRP